MHSAQHAVPEKISVGMNSDDAKVYLRNCLNFSISETIYQYSGNIDIQIYEQKNYHILIILSVMQLYREI